MIRNLVAVRAPSTLRDIGAFSPKPLVKPNDLLSHYIYAPLSPPFLSLTSFYFASFSLVHSFNRPRCVIRWVIDIDTLYARSLHNAVQFNWAEARSEEKRKEGAGLLLLEEPPGLHYKYRDR